MAQTIRPHRFAAPCTQVKGLIALLTVGLSSSAQAASTELKIQPKADGSTGIQIAIGYTLGTHEGGASAVSGSALVDFENAALSSAEFRVPISAMTTGNEKRDCHMREALGLDYAISGYPEAHVCDSSNRLPGSGVDAIQYPEVTFELTGLKAADGTPLTRVDAGSEAQVLAVGAWTIHGVRKEQFVTVRVARTDVNGAPQLRVRGSFDLLLKDFGVEVISWGGVIKVKDRAKVTLDLNLAEGRL
jgi:polyisoprenoid-binding protein YceI